mgnify:CR=1 FL=1
MSWVESNMQRMRNISGSAQAMADRAAASKEGSKNRLFQSLSDLASNVYGLKNREDTQEHESEMELQQQGGRENLQRMREGAAMRELREGNKFTKEENKRRRGWSSDERIAAEKSIEGMPEWNEDLYQGSWTDHNGKTWTWGNKQEYDLIKQDIMNEAAERAAAARNERELTDWWPAYEQLTGDMMSKRTDIWDPETDQFIGWGAAGKEELIEQFKSGIDRNTLTPEDQEAALEYFKTYLDNIEEGNVTKQAVAEGGVNILPPGTYNKEQQYEQGTAGQFNPGLVNTTDQDPGASGAQAGQMPGEVSPLVESYWPEVQKLLTVEPDTTFLGNEEKQGALWDEMKSLLSTITAEDLSTLSDTEEQTLGPLIRSGADSKMTQNQLNRVIELLEKVSGNKASRAEQLNVPESARPQPVPARVRNNIPR